MEFKKAQYKFRGVKTVDEYIDAIANGELGTFCDELDEIFDKLGVINGKRYIRSLKGVKLTDKDRAVLEKYETILTDRVSESPFFEFKYIELKYLNLQDDEEKRKHMMKALADRGFAPAMVRLSGLLAGKKLVANGEGVKYLRKAAELGDAEAMYWLGKYYEVDAGIMKSKKKAVELYKEAYDAGCYRALYELDYLSPSVEIDTAIKALDRERLELKNAGYWRYRDEEN